jgi:hypothetical protein
VLGWLFPSESCEACAVSRFFSLSNQMPLITAQLRQMGSYTIFMGSTMRSLIKCMIFYARMIEQGKWSSFRLRFRSQGSFTFISIPIKPSI